VALRRPEVKYRGPVLVRLRTSSAGVCGRAAALVLRWVCARAVLQTSRAYAQPGDGARSIASTKKWVKTPPKRCPRSDWSAAGANLMVPLRVVELCGRVAMALKPGVSARPLR
jgi:hypothetical protein